MFYWSFPFYIQAFLIFFHWIIWIIFQNHPVIGIVTVTGPLDSCCKIMYTRDIHTSSLPLISIRHSFFVAKVITYNQHDVVQDLCPNYEVSPKCAAHLCQEKNHELDDRNHRWREVLTSANLLILMDMGVSQIWTLKPKTRMHLISDFPPLG